MTDTFERSCEHWSENAREEMEDFYALATVDYRYIAESRDWGDWFVQRQAEVGERRLNLLDVACGSGKFPRALVAHGGVSPDRIAPVEYALLDPAAFSVEETKRVLPPPFMAGAEYIQTLQELDCDPGSFDVLWATHALYALPAEELETGMRKFVGALRSGGVGFIAHSTSKGHYVSFYRDFLEDFRSGKGTPYTNAEQITQTLDQLEVRYNSELLSYVNGVAEGERTTVQGYLQRCIFDDSVSLDALLAAPRTGAKLRDALDNSEWRFQQEVMLITIEA